MGVCQALRHSLRSGKPVVAPLEIKMICEEINALVDLPTYWELEARTVEKG
jgi:hypothetical protein